MSDHETDRPRLLLLGSGDRRYREYILAAVSAHCRLWMLDAQEATWQTPYLEGSEVVNVRDAAVLLKGAVLARAMGLPGSSPEAVLACRDKALTRSTLATAGPGAQLRLPPRGYMSRYGYVIAVDDDPAAVERDLADPERLVELRSLLLDG